MPGYDAVVIGSGVAGLSAACLLAESGRRVAVLEQHSVVGGLLQRFRRKGVLFDTGFHYAGGLGPGGPLRRYFTRLGVIDDLVLQPYEPDGFDEVVLPGRRFRFPVGRARVEAALTQEFASEAPAIRRVLARMDKVLDHHEFYSFRPSEPSGLPPNAEHATTVQDALDGVESTDLRAVLSAHTMLYGATPDRAPLAAHAPVTGALFHSCHGVEGGGHALAAALSRRLIALGGVVLLRTDVQQIQVTNGRVSGVDAGPCGTFATDTVVAAIHPAEVLRLLGEGHAPRRVAARVASLRSGPSALIAHGVVRGRPGSVPRKNWFWFESTTDALVATRPWLDTEGPPPAAIVLTGAPPPGTDIAAVFHVFCPLAPGAVTLPAADAWERQKLAALPRVHALVEDSVPEWRGRFEILDVSGPPALERFVRSPGGACYGADCSLDRWDTRRSLASLGVEGLRLAGQSVGVPGVLGATVTGFLAAGNLMGSLPHLYGELRAFAGPSYTS